MHCNYLFLVTSKKTLMDFTERCRSKGQLIHVFGIYLKEEIDTHSRIICKLKFVGYQTRTVLLIFLKSKENEIFFLISLNSLILEFVSILYIFSLLIVDDSAELNAK